MFKVLIISVLIKTCKKGEGGSLYENLHNQWQLYFGPQVSKLGTCLPLFPIPCSVKEESNRRCLIQLIRACDPLKRGPNSSNTVEHIILSDEKPSMRSPAEPMGVFGHRWGGTKLRGHAWQCFKYLHNLQHYGLWVEFILWVEVGIRNWVTRLANTITTILGFS